MADLDNEYGNLDNAGTGFALDDDADFHELFNEASAHEEENDEGDTSRYFTEGPVEEPHRTAPVVESFASPASPASPPPAPQVEVREEPQEESHSWFTQDTTPVVREEVPVPGAPGVVQAAPPASQAPSPVPRPTLPSTLTTEVVARIVRILDAYRSLNEEEKGAVAQFIGGGDPATSEEGFVLQALTVDPALPPTMEALRVAREHVPVERAFYVMELSPALLRSLGGLVAVFTGQPIGEDLSPTHYAREVVRGIEGLDNRYMDYVHATERILVAAEEG